MRPGKPVRAGDDRWVEYLIRIGNELSVPLSVASHTDRVSVALGDGHEADVVVVAFVAPKGPVMASPEAAPA